MKPVRLGLLLLGISLPAAWAETVGVFYDPTVPQARFAARELPGDLQQKNYVVELKPLAMLTAPRCFRPWAESP